MRFSFSSPRSIAAWTLRWLVILLLPVLSWLALSAAAGQILSDKGEALTRYRFFWYSGIALSIGSIAAVGIVSRREATPSQMANFFTGAFLANHFAMNSLAYSLISLLEYIGAIVFGLGIAMSIWLWRRKAIQGSND